MTQSSFLYTLFLIGSLLFSGMVFAHSAHDPIKDIEKYDRAVTEKQARFETTTNEEERLQSLQEQIKMMQRKLLALRNLMANDYPHLKEKMSKYKYDYMDSVDESIVQLKTILKQTDTLLDP